MKQCSICGSRRPLSEFSPKGKNLNGATRYESRCKSCRRELSHTNEFKARRRIAYRSKAETIKAQARESYARHKVARVRQKAEYREQKREKIRERAKLAYHRDPEAAKIRNRLTYAKYAAKRREYRRAYLKANPEKAKESLARTRERRRLSGKQQAVRREYYKKNKQRLFEYEAEYRRRNSNRNISVKLRNRINACLRYGKKSAATETLLGCSFSELVMHLKSLMAHDMTWDDVMLGRVHIDHIIPCCKFNLSDPEEQKRCFHYQNLQPLWAADNLRKAKKRHPNNGVVPTGDPLRGSLAARP